LSDEYAYDEQSAISLTIADRVNYPYLLANILLTIQRVLLEGDEGKINDAVEAAINVIPDQFEDEQYYEDLKKATMETMVCVRPRFAGFTTSEEFCKKHNIPTVQVETVRDPWLTQKAIYNLLQRRGMLSKKRWLSIDFDPEEWEKQQDEKRKLQMDESSGT